MIRSVVRFLRQFSPSAVTKARRKAHFRRKYGVTYVDPGDPCRIRNSSFGDQCKLSGYVAIINTQMGNFSYVESGTRIADADVGHFCSIAQNVQIGLASHPTRQFVSTHPFFFSPRPELGYAAKEKHHDGHPRTKIGHDVWVGVGACIKAGITIGNGAIIGAGAVITKDVPPYAIYAGVPAKLVRYRFVPEDIAFLQQVQWWHGDLDWIRKHHHLFRDVQDFRDAIKSGNIGTGRGLTTIAEVRIK